ncbi:MAG: serine hydrolase [Burkholderiaceae bacterium]|nr:serine hydrolase [Burkholderiaceae bacterium]
MNELPLPDPRPAIAREHLPRAEEFLRWPPGLQAYGYRIVDKLFASRTVPRGPAARALPRGAEISPVYDAGGTPGGVAEFFDRNTVAGLLVLRDGRVVLERYGLGLRESDRWSTMSTIKSMTAMLVGVALADGSLPSLDVPVVRFLPALAGSAYDRVTVRHLLTMSSGVRWTEVYPDRDSDVNRYSRSLANQVPGGVFEIMRALPAAHAPGAVWCYNSGDTYLLGAVISAATGRRLADYMAERIWQPAGMEFDAFYTIESPDGQEIGGSRAGMALRDFGRFAQLVADDGLVDGRRLLPAGWVDEVARPAYALPPETLAMPAVQALRLGSYGYSWWLNTDGAMIARGFAGQFLYIDRARRLVAVCLAAFPQPPHASAIDHDRDAEFMRFVDALTHCPA